MKEWQQFLQQQGAQYRGNELLSFAETSADYPQLLASHTLLFALNHWGTLSLHDAALGDGSRKMLQGQLTCDVNTLTQQHSLYGAHCTPKGRAIANFQLLMNTDDSIDLIMPAEQLAATTESFRKFAPFFKTTLSTGSRRLLGLAGPMAAKLCETAIGSVPDTPQQSVHQQGNSAVMLGNNRYLLLIAAESAESIWQSLASTATPVGSELWTLLDIRAGIAQITAAIREQFVPQMLNMQASHGTGNAINFKKGCYTGQEVVARMHYLGKLKRRMYRLKVATPQLPENGQQCYISEGTSQSQGTIASIARCDNDAVELLAVLTEKVADNQQLLIGNTRESAQPGTVEFLPLPYSLD